ncbi:MAG: hypothetical protein ACOC1U_10155 [Spirochaetota bacterium]
MRRPIRLPTFLLLPLVVLVVSHAGAQYAPTLAPLAAKEHISEAEALWLVGSVSGSLAIGASVDEAPELLEELNVIHASRVSEEGPVTFGRFSLFLLLIEETSPGFWFGLVPSAHTAFHYLQRVGVVAAGLTPSHVMSGGEAVDLTRRYLSFVASVDGEP